MSPGAHPPEPPAAPESWTPIPPFERRILGVLVEKQKTSKTADSYPLTLNALTLGCNQKSNRDPVLDLTEDDVEEALTEVQRRGLVVRMTGGRVDRFRHLLYEAWKVTKYELGVLAELLLRGPQTKGELRGRVSRMDPVDTLDALDEVLKPLFARGLAVWLTAPDRRGAQLTHGFHTPAELATLKAHAAAAPADPAEPHHLPRPAAAAPVAPDAAAALDARLTAVAAEVDRLKAAVADLARQVEDLRRPGPARPA